MSKAMGGFGTSRAGAKGLTRGRPATGSAAIEQARACLIVATGTPLGPTAVDPSIWSPVPAEAALERLAAELEGIVDQELVISGAGDCGDITLEVVESDVHETLRDRLTWLRTGAPAPKRRVTIVLHLVIEGDGEPVQAAAAELLRELARWVQPDGVTMTWRDLARPVPAATHLPQRWPEAHSR